MNAAQLREAARLCDQLHVEDDERTELIEMGRDGVVLRIGQLAFHERSKPLHLVPRRYVIARDGTSIADPSSEHARRAVR